MTSRSWLVVASLVLASTWSLAAQAQDEPATGDAMSEPAPTTDAVAPPPPHTHETPDISTDEKVKELTESPAGGIYGGHFGAFGTVSTAPNLAAFITLDPGIILAAGVGFTYDGNGIGSTATAASSDKVGFNFLLHFEYFVINTKAISLGPELTFFTNVAPGDAFSQIQLSPGLAFWYIPWQSPIAIGAAWQVAMNFNKGADPVIALQTPGLRLAYLFK